MSYTYDALYRLKGEAVAGDAGGVNGSVGYTRGKARPAQILHYARLCRVERVIRPYLEALV